MKQIRAIVVCCLLLSVCVFSTSCKDACDDLEDICKDCNADNKSECKSSHSTCTIVKGPAAKDCCEGIVDSWEEMCK
jgi:hypothetical protein